MASEKFCLRWNDFENNISSAFKELREDKSFFDVTLACDDEQVQAHKVILSACSPFFRNILRRNPHQHPLLYLKGVKYTDLQSVLNFMYHGEVNVAQEELNSFLAVAEDLRVKGLTQNHSESQSSSNRKSLNPIIPQLQKPQPRAPDRELPVKRPFQVQHPAPQPAFSQPEDDDIQEVVPVKSEPKEAAVTVPSTPVPPQPQQGYTTIPPPVNSQALTTSDEQVMGYEDSFEDYGQYGDDMSYDDGGMPQGGNDSSKVFVEHDRIASYISEQCVCQVDSSGTKYWCCGVCNKFINQRRDLMRHIECQHVETSPYFCSFCEHQFKTKRAVQRHTHTVHNVTVMNKNSE